MHFFRIFILLLVCSANLFGIEYIAPSDLPKPIGPFSPAVAVDLSEGKLLFVSGQVPKGEQDVAKATRMTMDNLGKVLKASGSDFEHVLRVDIFLKDMDSFTTMNTEYASYFPEGKYPARQTTQSDIPHLMEISCIALVP